MSDITIDSQNFYKDIMDKFSSNDKLLNEMIILVKTTQVELQNFNHTNKSKFEGVKMVTNASDNKLHKLELRINILEDDYKVRQQVGKWVNSSLGTKLMGLIILGILSLGGIELYKTNSPTQEKQIQKLELENDRLKDERDKNFI